ncbi:MAG: NB-ARC domain-containing protein, partial [Dehalococcoidia bacterium]
METEGISLRGVRQAITEHIQNGVLDNRVINALVCQDEFIPKECELWDYKRDIASDVISLTKTILRVVSFHNTYGGYLIYGVDEVVKDIKFVPVGISQGSLDLQQLRQHLANYTGEQIDISYAEITCDISNNSFLLGLLHVPKRPHPKTPTFLVRDGPQIENGENVFQKNKAYFRSQDKCVRAETKDDFQLLFSERSNPFLWDVSSPAKTTTSIKIIVDHNLPDRNFICPKFFGREKELQELWMWFADELANTKILAGDGGKGKTSIAYEFAEEVCRMKPYGIEKVIWLTAKSRQFIGILDRFVSVPQTNYYDLESLLRSICSELAVLEHEMEDASISYLKKLIKNAVDNISCLIIIDDIDSTELNEQKRICETAMQFPGSRVRFLLTTRMNIMFSDAQCITVRGLEKDDYGQYMANALTRFGCPALKPKQVQKMWKDTDGSPLFTDSLLRLYRMGMSIDKALLQWKGALGSEVRKAALQHEVEKLTLEARRVLLACSYMGEASLAELRQLTGYSDERIQMCIDELSALFLISAQPIIKKEVRFRVSNNTARLVLDNATLLVTDPKLLMDNVKKLREKYAPKLGKRIYLPVGAAIMQAIALLRDSNYDDAIDTIDAALTKFKNNPDLVLTKARCLLEKFKARGDSRSLGAARKVFDKSYSCGQRKEILYHLWYESETLANDPNGAVDVATAALTDKIPVKVEWLRKRAI